MKSRFVGAVALTSVTLLAGGCSANTPTYDAVKAEAITALEEIAATVPQPGEVLRLPEGDPYPCDDPLLLSQRDGAFFTGQWNVFVPPDFDFDTYISTLPAQLGEDWEAQDLGIEVSFAAVYLVNRERGVSVSVDEAEIDGRPALDLIAISRCGILPNDVRPRKSAGGHRR